MNISIRTEHHCLTTLKVGVSPPGSGAGQAPVPGVPANQGAVLTRAVTAQVCPHAEQVQLYFSLLGSRRMFPGPTAQPQGAGGGDGLSDDGPLRHGFPVNLRDSNMTQVQHQQQTKDHVGIFFFRIRPPG